MSEKEFNIEDIETFYLYSLVINGINCFKDKQILDLSDDKGNYSPWTIILGDNGTGKTTLLRILDRMQPKMESHGEDNHTFPIYSSEIRDRNPYHQVELTMISIADSKKAEIVVEKESNTISTSSPIYDFYLISYGASRRMSKNPNLNQSVENIFKITSLFDDSIELINAEEWFLKKEMISLKAEKSSQKKFRNQFNIVKTILIDILPDVEDIRVKPINKNNSKLLLEVLTPYGWVNLRDLSFGYQTLTALIVDIAAKMMDQYPDSNNPLSEPVIILIDEIDLHLHPKWQRIVLDKLSSHFPAAQFIATSHSPLIVQAAQDKGANIVVCRKEGDKVIIDNNPNEVKGWRIDQILVSDLFNTGSPLSNKYENLVIEKNNLLSKMELTGDDKERLSQINSKLNMTPVSTSKKDIEAEEIIRKAAELLKK